MLSGNPFWIDERKRAGGHRERDLRVKDVFCSFAKIDGEANRLSRILRVCSSGKKMERKKGKEDPKQNAVAHERVLQKEREPGIIVTHELKFRNELCGVRLTAAGSGEMLESVTIAQRRRMSNDAALFPRNFKKKMPVAVRGEGCWIFTQDGRKYLDAAGQAAVVNIGHGVAEIGHAMAEQSSQLAFASTTQFHSAPAEKLAARLLALAPPNFRKGGRVCFTSGGSEATETAIKLVRQYHLEKGQPARYRMLSRRQSYHGSTLGAMTVSGNVARRAPYQPLLAEWGHIAPCFCYHCPFEKTFPQCHLACADDLEAFLGGNDADSAAAFIFEPVVGATLGAAVPPEGYTARIAEICRKRGILLIADEVMTGMGRTGKAFAVQHWGLEPDIILVGKGIASGYAPLGAVLVASNVVEAFERGSGAFMHGFTYQAHPVATAAGNAVLDYIEAHNLFARVESAA